MKLPEKWQKVVEKRENTLFNKVLGENQKCVFYFYLKTKGTPFLLVVWPEVTQHWSLQALWWG